MRLNRGDFTIAAGVVAVLFLVYNADGREIGSYDSQPTKFAARELLLRGTLTLNHVVGAVPQYAGRTPFILSRDGQYRSGYSPVPAIAAAGLLYPAAVTGVIDLRSPSAPGLIAILAASTFTSIAVALLFLAARRLTSRGRALAIAVALGLGTGLWSLVSRTLWEHETAILGLAIAIVFFCEEGTLQMPDALGTAAGLALAGLARPQLAPIIAVILAGVAMRAPRRAAIAAFAVVTIAGGLLMLTYWRWFGHPLGAMIVMQAERRFRAWNEGISRQRVRGLRRTSDFTEPRPTRVQPRRSGRARGLSRCGPRPLVVAAAMVRNRRGRSVHRLRWLRGVVGGPYLRSALHAGRAAAAGAARGRGDGTHAVPSCHAWRRARRRWHGRSRSRPRVRSAIPTTHGTRHRLR